ncbi:XdhC family protein [Sphingobium boeckii]|uniref:Xanthine dehydrogenase accessory factor n=1 Tax=Sphingobium boeckii TaxID=1082345 RepID=A0A7W9AKD5_9SPHN|nr:XdhC family protein [Sphingobium boeckii]MBB5687284.1 xanthine dehydrogenase accessory factor [Sphingobium boeckii]
MDDLETLCVRAREWRQDGLALATVISTWGSAPRPKGSHMLVNADGRFEGSVSGGCVESDVLQAAADAIADGVSRVRSYGVADDDAWVAGLPCGGEISVLVQPVGEAGFPPALFDAIAAARTAGQRFPVSTDLATGLSKTGATPGQFINDYLPPRRVLIVGAVQIAQSLAPLCRAIGVSPVLIDPRGRFLTEERFPGVTLDDRWPDDAITAFAPDAATAVITLSHDPKIDDPALIAALTAQTGYIAALGSRKSQAARLERLGALGFSAADLARIDGPAGLDIGAVGPAEIALSIAAGMIQAFNDRG